MGEQFIERRFKLWLGQLPDNLVMTPREQQLLADAFFAGAKAALFTTDGEPRLIRQLRQIEEELKTRPPEHPGK